MTSPLPTVAPETEEELHAGLAPLLQETVARHVSPGARVTRFARRPMGEDERGWSGAEIRRYQVWLHDRDPITLITKTMPLKERRVLLRLTEQGQAGVPYTHTRDLATDAPVLAAMQDVGGDPAPRPADLAARSARTLAAIHHANLGAGAALPWLPPADRTYYADFLVPEVWRAHWDRMLASNPAFAREFAAYTPRLEAAAAQLIHDMTALWDEGTANTITNGDIHPPDGGNFAVYGGQPYFLDWGWTYYGPFYLDLPNLFTAQTVQFYRQALADRGLAIPERDFMDRYHAAGRYVGFKYLCAGIWQWPPGPTAATGRMLLHMLQRALTGAFPESAFAYSATTWRRLLAAHRRFTSSE